MNLTLRLGKQYLWVDKYCIKQDPQNDEEKQHKLRQLDAMGETYGSAVATIVAVEGTGEDHGVCGVGLTRRNDLSIRTVDGLQLIKNYDEAQSERDDLDIEDGNVGKRWIPLSGRSQTPWAKSGLTFQEGLLSLRLLFLFDTGVYYDCHTTACRESDRLIATKSLHWCEPPGFTADKEQNPGRGLGVYADTAEDIVLERYWACFQDYSICSLIFDDDALVAFTGILQRFTSPPPTSGLIPLVCGSLVQFSGHETSPILPGLAWEFSGYRKYPTRRRKFRTGNGLLPSWTWAAWEGQVVAPMLNEMGEDFSDLLPLATVTAPLAAPVRYLRVEAQIMVAPTEKLRTAERILAEIPMECDNFDGYLTPQELITRSTPDAELYRKLNQDAWDIAILYSYSYTHRLLNENLHKYEKVFVLILKWLDKDKTKAERIGGRHLTRSQIEPPDGEGLTEERHIFDLY